jgi:hypothetical protein
LDHFRKQRLLGPIDADNLLGAKRKFKDRKHLAELVSELPCCHSAQAFCKRLGDLAPQDNAHRLECNGSEWHEWMGDSKRRKKLLGQEYGQIGKWESVLLSAVGRPLGEAGLLDRSIETAGISATLSVIGPFRNLRDTKVNKAQIGLQKISSAIVGSELRLIGHYEEQEFSIEGVGFVFAESPEHNPILKTMWLGNNAAPLNPELVEILQDPESELLRSISQVVCDVAIATGQ